ncbi:hypothetical protein MUN89_15545 [Halobacillus salinarum]|uniref:Uncharacterized protein n=1 Tax=Halobacillus salinarum TaxID=2932257 RepID=A0ABY4EGQ2_9BACI|nr:hypothetical protein [Halobacillus salinarum]UOQ43324.1 hypothetical protein MUN89_15545 [Halobacillus salinarum]
MNYFSMFAFDSFKFFMNGSYRVDGNETIILQPHKKLMHHSLQSYANYNLSVEMVEIQDSSLKNKKQFIGPFELGLPEGQVVLTKVNKE